MAQEEVKIDLAAIEHFRQSVTKTPYPEISTVTPDKCNRLSPNAILGRLEQIAKTGIFKTEDDRRMYLTLKEAYDKYVAK